MATPFTFDAGFQRAVLRLMMVDEAFSAKAMLHLEAGHFTVDVFGWMFRMAVAHTEHYGMHCTELPLRDAVRQLDDQHRARYCSELDAICALGTVSEAEFVKEKLKDFCQQAVFAVAHQESAALFNSGERDRAYDVMAAAQERIQDIAFDQPQRMWVFDELPERQRARWRAQIDPSRGVFTTGIPQLDDACGGGVHLGELFAVFAYAKRCKTTWLINQGFLATRVHRRPTAHLLLEGRLEQVAARYDARFSQELYTKVKRGEIASELYAHMQNEFLTLRRLLVLRRLEGWDNTIMDVRAELHYLKSQGFVPEMLLTDYMDLGRKRDPGRGESETTHQLAFARDLKRLHENENMAGWSAWQAQRPKKGAHTTRHVLSSSSVADAYAKVRIVTAFGSLNATDEEMERGEMRLFMEGHRDASVNKVWLITNDLSRMTMAKTATEYIPPEPEGESSEWAS